MKSVCFMRTVTLEDAKVRLEELARHVQSTGESIGLTKDDQVIVVLGPAGDRLPQGLTAGELADRIAKRPRMSQEEAESFARDVEEGIRFFDRR